MKEFTEQSLMYLFSGFTIGGVIVVILFAICVLMLSRQDKD